MQLSRHKSVSILLHTRFRFRFSVRIIDSLQKIPFVFDVLFLFYSFFFQQTAQSGRMPNRKPWTSSTTTKWWRLSNSRCSNGGPNHTTNIIGKIDTWNYIKLEVGAPCVNCHHHIGTHLRHVRRSYRCSWLERSFDENVVIVCHIVVTVYYPCKPIH